MGRWDVLGDSNLCSSVLSDFLYHLSFLANNTTAVSIISQHLEHHLTVTSHTLHTYLDSRQCGPSMTAARHAVKLRSYFSPFVVQVHQIKYACVRVIAVFNAIFV